MAASWSVSHTLGTREKVFSWRIDNRGNIFIKRKFKNGRFPRIDKISCSHLDKLQSFMQDMEWKALASSAVKLYRGTEKEGIGKFLYRLRQEVPYAQLASQLASIFYHSEVWDWNKQKRGMKFLHIPGNWKEKTNLYYRSSLALENEEKCTDNFLEICAESKPKKKRKKPQKNPQKTFQKTLQETYQQTILQQETLQQEAFQQETFQQETFQQEAFQQELIQKIEQTTLSAFFSF